MHDTDQAALDATRAVLAGPTRHPSGHRRLPEVSIPRPPRRVLGAAGVVGVFLIGFVAGTVRHGLAVPPWSVLLGALGIIGGFVVGLPAPHDVLGTGWPAGGRTPGARFQWMPATGGHAPQRLATPPEGVRQAG